jgi:hypothetical protein
MSQMTSASSLDKLEASVKTRAKTRPDRVSSRDEDPAAAPKTSAGYQSPGQARRDAKDQPALADHDADDTAS